MRDLFTLGDEYANATETSEIFASVNGEVTATLAAEQAPMPELNHADGQFLALYQLCCSAWQPALLTSALNCFAFPGISLHKQGVSQKF